MKQVEGDRRAGRRRSAGISVIVKYFDRALEAGTVQLSYDPRRNIAYLRLREAAGTQVEMIRLSDEVNIDLGPDGTVYGIELLNADA